MAKERRVNNGEIIKGIATLTNEVKGINRRLNIINGATNEFNRVCPMYRGKVDNIENCIEKIEPQVTGLKVKLYTGMGLISFISVIVGGLITKFWL